MKPLFESSTGGKKIYPLAPFYTFYWVSSQRRPPPWTDQDLKTLGSSASPLIPKPYHDHPLLWSVGTLWPWSGHSRSPPPPYFPWVSFLHWPTPSKSSTFPGTTKGDSSKRCWLWQSVAATVRGTRRASDVPGKTLGEGRSREPGA